ncbi:hypothetical protein Tco_1368644 [Tanacetum coccineum]
MSCNTTSRTLASIAIEVIISLNFMLIQSISHASGYQCPDSCISHWGGGSGSGRGGYGSGCFSWSDHARVECAGSAYHCPRSSISAVQQSESVTLSPESVPLEAVSVICGLLPATLHSQSGVLRP